MKIIKKYQVNEKDAFHLSMQVNFRHGNSIQATIPNEILRRNFFTEIHNAKYTYIFNENAGLLYLDKIASKIIAEEKMAKYFYPTYLLKGGTITERAREVIMNKMEVLTCVPGSHYSIHTDPVSFFVLDSLFKQDRYRILSNARVVGKTFFFHHCTNMEMELDYFKLRCFAKTAILLEEDGQPNFLMLLGHKELLMVISI